MADSAALRERIQSGFRTSSGLAHGAADAAFPEPPVRVPEVPLPAILGQKPPQPLPKNGAPPAPCRANYQSTSVPSHKTRVFRGGDELLSLAEQRMKVDPETAKQALALESSNNSKIGNGALDDDVMKVYLDGKSKEMSHSRTRHQLLSEPLRTPLPGAAKSSSEHCELLSVHRAAANHPITRYDRTHSPTSGLARRGTAEDLESTRRRLSPTANESASRRGELKHVESLASTYREHFDKVDAVEVFAANSRYATEPVLHGSIRRREQDNTEGGLSSTTASSFGQTSRRDDPQSFYATTYALNTAKTFQSDDGSMINASANGSRMGSGVDRKHHMHGTFNVVGGVRLISPQCHHPRQTGAPVSSPTDVVPGHFATTNQLLFSTAVPKK